jgi:TRAP-type C4-dicarboxylate transport system substrate-binding protein
MGGCCSGLGQSFKRIFSAEARKAEKLNKEAFEKRMQSAKAAVQARNAQINQQADEYVKQVAKQVEDEKILKLKAALPSVPRHRIVVANQTAIPRK